MRRVLIMDFDFFSALGGGQTFYRRLVERNPTAEFFYPSSGADLRLKESGRLPSNAHPFRFAAGLDVGTIARVVGGSGHWSHLHYAEQVARVGIAVQGMTFDVVDVPSFFPAAHLVRPVLTALGIMVEKVVLGLVGWPSVSAGNAYENETTPDLLGNLVAVERASFEAADVRYTISNLEAAGNTEGNLPVSILAMHDAVEVFPVPAKDPPGNGPPDLWYVGRLDGAKGTDIFIELASRMPKRLFRRCMFTGPDNVWVKDARWSERLLSLARERGLDATYMGTMSDADVRRDVYAGRSVLVVPSRNDAFNYVALEGVLNGCPMLLSERTGAYGFLRDNYPHLLPVSMSPEDLDTATDRLHALLKGYRSIARQCRGNLIRKPFPSPTAHFMDEVYGAAAAPTPARHAEMLSATLAMRAERPLLMPIARQWRSRFEPVADPAVTIVIPTLDRPTLLAPTLACLTRQTLRSFEVIVVDDGSKDGAAVRDAARAFAPMVRYLRIGNVGEAGAVNRGLAIARGRYVNFLSDDDAYAPELLAESVAVLDDNPEAIATYPDWDVVDSAGCFVEAHRLPAFDRQLMISCHWCIPGPGVVVRRDVLNLVGGRDLSFRFASDFDLWLRATAFGAMIHLPGKRAYWRLHASNLTMSDRRLQMADERIRLVDQLFKDPSEAGRSGAYRPRAYAAAHLTAAAILGTAEAEAAAGHLKEANRHDPRLMRNLPPNMIGYPAIWPRVSRNAAR